MRLLSLLLILIAGAAPANDIWKRDVIYFVMLDRFADGDRSNNRGVDINNPLAFHGGDLKGLADNLGEIADLGATAVWLSPIVKQVGPIESDEGTFHGHHGYWADSFTEIDPRYGTEADLKHLVGIAHSMGMKVILDVVYNHVGYDAEWTKTKPEWLRQGDQCGGDAITLCLAGLPDLRTELHDVREHLFEAHIGLAERTGLDGFRLDTVKHISHEFWQEHRDQVRKRLGPDFLLLGEVWDADKYLAEPYFENDELDAITDFGFRDRTLKFLSGVSDAKRYSRYFLKRHNVADGKLLAPFLSNHDMPMLLAMLRGDKEKLKLAATLLFTSQGLPVLAWGEEIGRNGGLWPDNREDMDWGDRIDLPNANSYRDDDLKRHFQGLVQLRHSLPELASNATEIVHADGRSLAFTRGSDLLVLINASEKKWAFGSNEFPESEWTAVYQTKGSEAAFLLPPVAAAIFSRKR
jgi:glycosidase